MRQPPPGRHWTGGGCTACAPSYIKLRHYPAFDRAGRARLTGCRGGSYARYMPRRVVWYPAGSPAATQLSALPGDLEALPLPAAGVPPPGPDESAAVLVDLTAGDAAVATALAAAAPDLPVVALVAPG